MVEMAKCAKCKKLFPRFSLPICDSCEKEEETIFDLVKEYLRDHPKTTVGEVSEATGVSTKKILGYLREGRIEIHEGAGLACGHCGTGIRSGQLCKDCFENAAKKINNMVNPGMPEPQRSPELPRNNKALPMGGARRR
ncbi:MAG: MerR family transcriptional regulator [Defluviitaleaceae bacterium]|nr:MerR family transcriptional regulator [Defluviitaleaceae bacterium]